MLFISILHYHSSLSSSVIYMMTYIKKISLLTSLLHHKGAGSLQVSTLNWLQFGPKSNLHSRCKTKCIVFFTLFLVCVSFGCITSHINPAEFVVTILCLNIIYLTYLWASLKRLTSVCPHVFNLLCVYSCECLCLIYNLLCHDDAVTFIYVIIMHYRNVCLLQKQLFVYHFNFVSWRGRIKKAHLWHLKINHLFPLLYNQ